MGFFHIQNVDENGQKSWSLTNKLVGSRWFTAKNTIHLQKPECNRHASTHVAYEDTYIYIHSNKKIHEEENDEDNQKKTRRKKKKKKKQGRSSPFMRTRRSEHSCFTIYSVLL